LIVKVLQFAYQVSHRIVTCWKNGILDQRAAVGVEYNADSSAPYSPDGYG
jgi:hypothetical protein